MKCKKDLLYYVLFPVVWLVGRIFAEPERDDSVNSSGLPKDLDRLGFRLVGDRLIMPRRAEGYQSKMVGDVLVVSNSHGRKWDVPGATIMIPQP